MRARTLLVALALACPSALPADAGIGIVLLHGKQGTSESLAGFAATLNGANYLTERPEMCWSRDRIYDRPYLDCLREIDAAVGRLKQRGATGVVVLGMSLGGNGALGYGARYPGLKGVITLVPGHAPEIISRQPEIAAAIEHARALIAAGQGDVRMAFPDRNTRVSSFAITVNATPKVYLNFLSPDSPSVMPVNAAHLTAPLLYVSANNDPTQRGRGYIFDQAPENPLNRYVTVSSDHIGTPAVSQQIVLDWLKTLGSSGQSD